MRTLFFTAVIASLFVGGLIGYLTMNNQGQDNVKGLDYSRVETIKVLEDITASTTSGVIDINGASRVMLSLDVADTDGVVQASSTFAVTVSADGTNYVTYNKLVDNVTNTNAETLTRVASVAINENQTKVYAMDLQHDLFKFMKITDTIVGNGTTTVNAVALINY